jgi:RNA polymerase sigma factor (sigma-70 family)
VEQLQSSHPRWDKEVCERLVGGDEAALGELYDEFSPLVYGLAARVTRDWAAAEDITQEVFVRVWENPQAFDPARGTWRGWLGTMTHRRAVDWVRRSAARRRRTADEATPIAAPDPRGDGGRGVGGQVRPGGRGRPARGAARGHSPGIL